MSSLALIALSGSAAGLLDITATGILGRAGGMRFQTLLQFVASGALGNRAYQGGEATALLGLIHFLIAVLWAAAYFILSRHTRVALLQPWLFGTLYGALVHMLMSLVVVPYCSKAISPDCLVHSTSDSYWMHWRSNCNNPSLPGMTVYTSDTQGVA